MERILRYLCVLFTAVAACAGQQEEEPAMKIQSPSFKQGETIPVGFTCDGADVSPHLSWSDLPEGTRSLALIFDDPDAPMGTWVHWVLYNIPVRQSSLAEGIAQSTLAKLGIMEGTNDFRRTHYGGPCPPSGSHRYYFRLYALDSALNLKPGVTKDQLVKAMQDHLLGSAVLMGRYTREQGWK